MLEITVSQAQANVPVTILQPHGELDASNYRELIAKAQELHLAGTQYVLLDLSETTYMSSSGIVALQSIAAMLRGDELPDLEAGWGTFHSIHRDRETGFQPHFKLLKPQPRVDQVLEMVGFKRFLEVHTNLDAALASF